MQQSILVFILLTIISSITYGQDKNKLAGEWVDPQDSRYQMNFYADYTAEMLANGKSSLSQKATITYSVDYSKKPHWLDLTLTRASGESMTVTGILEFVNDSTVRIYFTNPTEARPADFDHVEKSRIGNLTRSRHSSSEAAAPNNRYIVSGKRDGKDFTDTVEIKDEYVLNELKKIEKEGKDYRPTAEETKEEFDEKGNLIKKYATSLEKSLYKLSYTRYTYNKANQQTKIENFDAQHKLVNTDYDIAVTDYKYDKNGNLIEERYFDQDLKPAVFELGPHIMRNTYDSKNRVDETTFLDRDSKPLKDFARIKHVYDKSGKLIEMIYFDGSGKEFKREKQ